MAPRGVPTALRRARAALEAGDLGAAAELYGRVLSTPNTDPDAFATAAYGMARCLHARGDLRRAERMYALAAGSGDDPMQQWNCCMALCHLSLSRHDLSEAARYGALALRCCPPDDRRLALVTRQTLGSILIDMARHDEALEHLREALDLEPESDDRGYLLYLAGRALAGQGSQVEAARHLREAVSLLTGEERSAARCLLDSLG